MTDLNYNWLIMNLNYLGNQPYRRIIWSEKRGIFMPGIGNATFDVYRVICVYIYKKWCMCSGMYEVMYAVTCV